MCWKKVLASNLCRIYGWIRTTYKLVPIIENPKLGSIVNFFLKEENYGKGISSLQIIVRDRLESNSNVSSARQKIRQMSGKYCAENKKKRFEGGLAREDNFRWKSEDWFVKKLSSIFVMLS